MFEIFLMKIPRFLFDKQYKSLLDKISYDSQKKVQGKKNLNDRYLSIFAELLAMRILMNKYNLSRADVEFKRNIYGKPFINENIHFNISHSHDWVAFIHSTTPVGIDIEQINYSLDIEYKEITTPEEMIYIKSPDDFFKLWTLKESYVKCTGTGFSISPNTFSILQTNQNIFKKKLEYFSRNFHYSSSEDDFSFFFTLFEGYYLSVCAKGTMDTELNINDKIIIIDNEEFLGHF